jgi:tight adherence protein C
LVVDAHDDPRCLVSGVAVLTGSLALAVVLILGAIARPRSPRPPPSAAVAAPSVGDRARRVPWAVFGLAFAAGGAIVVAGIAPVAIAAVAGWSVRHQRRRAALVRRRREVEAAMPDAVELLVLCIRAGCSPTQAVVELVSRAPPPLRPAFAAVDLQLHRGLALADALEVLGAHAGSPGREIGRAIAAADRDGLPLAPVLDRLVTEARAIRRRQGEEAAQRLPVRLTFPLVTCTLPSFVLLAIAPAVLGALSTLRAHAP